MRNVHSGMDEAEAIAADEAEPVTSCRPRHHPHRMHKQDSIIGEEGGTASEGIEFIDHLERQSCALLLCRKSCIQKQTTD